MSSYIVRTFAWFLDITPNAMFSLYEYLISGKNGLLPCEEHGMDNGEFISGDARQVTITIRAALGGTLLLWANAPEMFRPEEKLRATIALLIKGLEATK